MWGPMDHLFMGTFLFGLGSWLLGAAVFELLLAFLAFGDALLVGVLVAGAVAIVGALEVVIAVIGYGVRSGRA